MRTDTAKCYRDADRSTIVTSEHDFGAADAKGRAIGAKIHRCTTETARVMHYTDTGAPIPKDADLYGCRRPKHYANVPGLAYGFSPSATRDGKSFGASQMESWYPTEAEREEGVAAYLKAAAKRAAKKTA